MDFGVKNLPPHCFCIMRIIECIIILERIIHETTRSGRSLKGFYFLKNIIKGNLPRKTTINIIIEMLASPPLRIP